MAEPITITLQAGTLMLLAERAYVYLIQPRLRTKEDAIVKGNSGAQDPAFWKSEFREAIDEKLDQRVIPILENQSKILESLARTQEGLAQMLTELVGVSRARRR